MNISSIGASGMYRASDRFEKAATNIANMGTGGETADLATQIVEMKQAQTSFEASALVVRSANEMTGKILDILA